MIAIWDGFMRRTMMFRFIQKFVTNISGVDEGWSWELEGGRHWVGGGVAARLV